MSTKIIIVDDHSLIAEGVSNMLRYNSEIEVVATYTSGKDLLKGLEQIMPDIVLMDINMPEMQGDELAAIIKPKYPEVKIIALTSFENIFYIKTMLQHKIEGYILKNITREALADAITFVHNGGIYIDEAVQKLIREDETIAKRQKAIGSMLTKREKEILQLLAANHTSAEIAEKLFLSKRTVEHHRESILSKLDVKKTSALIQKAIDLNLIRI